MQPPNFHEVQYASGWFFLLLAGTGVLLPAGIITLSRFIGPRKNRAVVTSLSVCVSAIPFLLCAALLLFYGKMTTEVTGQKVRVRFGWLTGYTETIRVTDINDTKVVSYDATVEYGGWGIRARGPNNRALNQWGDRGVRLWLKGDRSLLIGSQRPQGLAAAIARARECSGKVPGSAAHVAVADRVGRPGL